MGMRNKNILVISFKFATFQQVVNLRMNVSLIKSKRTSDPEGIRETYIWLDTYPGGGGSL